MNNKITFPKHEIFKQFTTQDLIAELIRRNNDNLKKLCSTYILTGVLTLLHSDELYEGIESQEAIILKALEQLDIN
ncbi:hypothetical protein I6E31_05420 [Fusobacterium varium]|nr:hypothetical protein [Fusobacterium varium]